MKAKKSLAIISCCIAASIGIFVLEGCMSQQTRKSQANTAEAGAKKTGKTVISAQQVPMAVKKAFAEKFPATQAGEWKLKSGAIYEAEFTLRGAEVTAMFDSAGKWLETEVAIDPDKVPKEVSTAAASQFKGYQVIETQSIERPGEPGLSYELHLENAVEIVKTQFSSAGALLKQAAKAKK